MDYLIDCSYHSETERLFLIGGTAEGTVVIAHVNLEAIEGVVGLDCGHSDVVRCAYFDPEQVMMFTGSEDGRICTWSQHTLSQQQEPRKCKAVKAVKVGKGRRSKPYDKKKTEP